MVALIEKEILSNFSSPNYHNKLLVLTMIKYFFDKQKLKAIDMVCEKHIFKTRLWEFGLAKFERASRNS